MRNNFGNSSRLVRWLFGLAAVASAVIAFSIYQSKTQTTAPSALATMASTQASPIAGATQGSSVPAQPTTLRISAEKANLVATVIELYYSANDGWNLDPLGLYAGHLEGTPYIGHNGNYVLAGHVEMKDGSPGPFANLQNLAPGDKITILDEAPNKQQLIQYSVTEMKITAPTDFAEIQNHGHEELTLVTCDNYNFKTKSYDSRVVVHAIPVSTFVGQ